MDDAQIAAARRDMVARGVRPEMAAAWLPKGHIVRKWGAPVLDQNFRAAQQRRENAFNTSIVRKTKLNPSAEEKERLRRRFQLAKRRAEQILGHRL